MTQAEQYEKETGFYKGGKCHPIYIPWLEQKCDRLEAANAEMLEVLTNIVKHGYVDRSADEIVQRNTPKEG